MISTRTIHNPFSPIKKVESSQDLLDLAFSSAMKVQSPQTKGTSKVFRQKEHEKNRINTAANVLSDRLDRIVHQFPSIDVIHPFYRELSGIIIGHDKLKKALGRIFGTINVLRSISGSLILDIDKIKDKEKIREIRGAAFGRMSHATNKLQNELELLESTRYNLSKLPGYDPSSPCVVVAGVPNVGKSSFVSSATSGKPEIASYPFTTKKLIFGHRKFGFLPVQFCDTPGLLDRPIFDRNPIELQAIAALKHISDLLLIIIDPSTSATFTVDDQLKLVEEFIDFYPGTEVLCAINKSDLLSEEKQIALVEKVQIRLRELSVNEERVLATPLISSIDPLSVQNLVRIVEGIMKSSILRNRKFKSLIKIEIADDQLTLEESLVPEF